MTTIEGARHHHTATVASTDTGPAGSTIRSVDNTLQILLMLRDHPTLRVSEIAAELGVARSTAHRLLGALVHRGFIARNPETRHYHAGARLWELGLATMASLDGPATGRCLDDLSAETGETCHLVTLEGTSARFVTGRAGRLRNQVGSRDGTRLPAHATSGGKVLLAHLAPHTIAALYPQAPMALTDRTILTVPALEAELARVRRRGFAAAIHESEDGLAALAVGVWGPSRDPVAALAIALPASRMPRDDARALLKPLRRAAARLSTALGGAAPAAAVPV